MFEYQIWTFHPSKLSDVKILEELNRRGSDGWELITLQDAGGRPFEKQAYFKRQMPSPLSDSSERN